MPSGSPHVTLGCWAREPIVIDVSNNFDLCSRCLLFAFGMVFIKTDLKNIAKKEAFVCFFTGEYVTQLLK